MSDHDAEDRSFDRRSDDTTSLVRRADKQAEPCDKAGWQCDIQGEQYDSQGEPCRHSSRAIADVTEAACDETRDPWRGQLITCQGFGRARAFTSARSRSMPTSSIRCLVALVLVAAPACSVEVGSLSEPAPPAGGSASSTAATPTPEETKARSPGLLASELSGLEERSGRAFRRTRPSARRSPTGSPRTTSRPRTRPFGRRCRPSSTASRRRRPEAGATLTRSRAGAVKYTTGSSSTSTRATPSSTRSSTTSPTSTSRPATARARGRAITS